MIEKTCKDLKMVSKDSIFRPFFKPDERIQKLVEEIEVLGMECLAVDLTGTRAWQDLREALGLPRTAEASSRHRGLARDLVTVGEYNKFSKAMGWSLMPGRDRQPVTGVSWCDADAYCRWAGGRLPTEEELIAAETGVKANWLMWPLNDLPDAGTSGVVSADGIRDVLGVVYQWTSTAKGSNRVIRGGFRSYDAGIARGAFRSVVDPGIRCGYLGFRIFFPGDET